MYTCMHIHIHICLPQVSIWFENAVYLILQQYFLYMYAYIYIYSICLHKINIDRKSKTLCYKYTSVIHT